MYNNRAFVHQNAHASRRDAISGVSPIWESPHWSLEQLLELKQGRTVAVVLPALDEEATVAQVINSIKPLHGTLVDELWVVDSGSSDATIEKAREAGAQVAVREEALPEVDTVPGKGEVLWRSLAIVQSDIIAFLDSDLINPDPQFVPKLIGPLLEDPQLKLVKAYYRRPLRQPLSDGHVEQLQHEGGRVTELTVRPLLAALEPAVSQIIQPLGGEYAGTREHLQSIPFAPGYGVDIGILLDTVNSWGIESVGQVDLGVKQHRNRSLQELGAMSRQVVATLLSRCGITDSGSPLVQFVEQGNRLVSQQTQISLEDRPSFSSLHI